MDPYEHPDNANYDERLAAAQARLDQLKRFYQHIGAFIIVNIILLIVNMIIGGGWWFFFVTAPWALALVVHAFMVYGNVGNVGRQWEEEKLKDIMEDQNRE